MKKSCWWIFLFLLVLPLFAHAAPYGMVYTKQYIEQMPLEDLFATPTRGSSIGLLYHGGPVLAAEKAYAVMWGSKVDPATSSGIGGMLSATLNSSYWDMLREYSTTINSVDGRSGTNQHLGRGSFGGSFTIQPANAKKLIDDTEIGAEIEHQIEIGALPKPDADSFFMIYFPPGVTISLEGSKSCQVFCGYHHNYASHSYGILYYGVLPDLGGACAFGCSIGTDRFGSVTSVTSHELTEAATDPTANASTGILDGWNTQEGKEIGDLCASTETKISLTNGNFYELQSAWDNGSESCPIGPFHSP